MTKRGVTTLESVRKQAQDLQDYENAAKLALPIAEALGMPLPTIEEMTEEPKQEVQILSIRVPMLNNTFDGYFSNRHDVKLTERQAHTLKAILFGLQSKYTRLANGKEVTNGVDVFKWILENLA